MRHSGAPMTDHDTTVERRPVLLRLSDTRGWSWDWRGDVYSASGPCPRCHAPDQHGQTFRQGPVHDAGDRPGDSVDTADSGDRDADRPDLDVEVDVECRCGPEHEKGTTGCGARWVVRVGDVS